MGQSLRHLGKYSKSRIYTEAFLNGRPFPFTNFIVTDNLQFILKLKDLLTPAMQSAGNLSETEATKIVNQMHKIEKSADGAKGGFQRLHGGIASALGALGFIGVAAGLTEFVHQGMEAAHALHVSEAALKNTMQNMGTYSDEAFEKVVKGSVALSQGILFGRSQIIDLQSQLRLVGHIGEGEMNRLVTASADMATKFHMGLEEAGNAIAKAVNNPEMLRRLAMQLKIDPSLVIHLQNLAKHGHEAQARLELLNIVEQKVGGAAKAAFDADPTAKYNKIIGDTKLYIGEVALKIKAALAPAMVWLATKFEQLVKITVSIVHWFKEHKVITGILAVVLLSFTALVVAYEVAVTASSWATKAWTVASKLLNVALWTNPVTWIVLGIIALIAVIGMVIYMFDGWGKQWDQLMKFSKFSWAAFKDYFSLKWLEVQDSFMTGIELIEKGWYHLKSLWDADGAAAGLSKINNLQNSRAQEIMKAKGLLSSDVANASASLTWEIHRNDKSLSTVVTDLKKKLGLGGMGVNPTTANRGGKGGSIGGAGGGDLSDLGKSKSDGINSGGQRSIIINIGKQIEKLEVHVMDAKEGVTEMENMVREAMRRVVYSMNGVAS